MTVALKTVPVVEPWPDSLDARLRRVKELLEELGLSGQFLAGKEKKNALGVQRRGWTPPAPPGPSVDDLFLLIENRVVELSFNSVLARNPVEIQDGLTSLYPVDLGLTLHKDRLLAWLGVSSPHTDIYLFLYGEALADNLSLPMKEIEGREGVFERATGERKTLILLADREVLLDGSYLAVLGGSFANGWKLHCPAADEPPDPGPVQELHEKVLDPAKAVSWIGFFLRHLTPIQLAAEAPDVFAGDPVVQAFHRKRIELVAVYTANQTREILAPGQRKTELLCRFQGERSSGDVLLGRGDGMDAGHLSRAAKILGELASWIYACEPLETDRLTVLRNIFANQLADRDAGSNYRFLIHDAGRLAGFVKNSWNSFIEGELSEYFDRVRRIEELIDRTAETFREHLQTLIKSMSENMLAGVGVVIASLVAAMFGSDFNAGVFRFGLILYALYLLIFPGLIGISSIRTQAKEAEGTYKLQVDCFSRSAPKELVEEVLSRRAATVEKARARFYTWFSITAGIYAAAILALLLIGWLVPGRL